MTARRRNKLSRGAAVVIGMVATVLVSVAVLLTPSIIDFAKCGKAEIEYRSSWNAFEAKIKALDTSCSKDKDCVLVEWNAGGICPSSVECFNRNQDLSWIGNEAKLVRKKWLRKRRVCGQYEVDMCDRPRDCSCPSGICKPADWEFDTFRKAK